jgi:hypothetical protein
MGASSADQTMSLQMDVLQAKQRPHLTVAPQGIQAAL